MQFGFSIYGAWWFSLIYLIFAFGLWFIFPQYVQIRFNKIKDLGLINKLYHICYILLLISTIAIPFLLNTYLVIGSILFVIGLVIFISALYYFAISPLGHPVKDGIYSLSRHPVYWGFSIMWLGVFVASLNIVILLLIVLITSFSIKVAKAEEYDCLKSYGTEYEAYRNHVHFFFGRK